MGCRAAIGLAAALLVGCARAQVNDAWQEGMAPKLDGPYCMADNCYTLLGVTRDSEAPEIKKAYRALARDSHPDKNPGADRAVFQKIAAAYEVLSSESRRRAYDWGLDNPMVLSAHLSQFRTSRAMPKSDVRYILVFALAVVNALQWMYRASQHKLGLARLKADTRSRRDFEVYFAQELAAAKVPAAEAKAAMDSALEAALATAGKATSGKAPKKAATASASAVAATPSPTVLAALAAADAKLLAEHDPDGLFAPPDASKLFVTQLITLPVTIMKWLAWYVRWLVMFDIAGQPYGDAEKAYLTRKALDISESRWESLEETKRSDHLAKELWVAEKLAAYEREHAKGAKRKTK
jgi:curved DNA-binding protein CbpA